MGFYMKLQSKGAARLPRTAPGLSTLPNAATALDGQGDSRAPTSGQAALSSAERHVEAARADLAALIAEDQAAAHTDHIGALYAIVAVLRISDRSLAPGQAAYIVRRTPETIISWCRRYAVGAKFGGRWIVDPLRLALLLLGGAS